MRYLITFSYDGSQFYGYQKQHNQRTVQEEIEKVLSKINNSNVSISASGRTDAKVHALNQTAHFDFNKKIETKKILLAMNSLLPEDIHVKNIKKVKNNFHARYDVLKKEYEYKMNIGQYDPFKRNYEYQYNKKIDIEKMKSVIKIFEGEHNFKSFTKTTTEEKDYIRTIYNTTITIRKNIVTIKFIGNGFLRYMVRNMVGSLIAVGENKLTENDIKKILEKQNRTAPYRTAHPEGLYLKKVYYK